MSIFTLAITTTLALAGVGAPVAVVPAAAPQPRPPVIIAAPEASVTDVIDPYAKDQNPGAESRSADTPVEGPTTTLLGAPSALSAPATGSPERRLIRISAIHIDRPAKLTLTPTTVTPVGPEPTPVPVETVTETVVVAPAEDEEEVVEQAEEEVPREAGAICMPPEGNYDGVEPYVGIIGAHIQQRFGVTEVIGKAGRSNASEHPVGLALDFMTNTGNVDGDAVRDYLAENAKEFGIKYVIWEQQITLPGEEPRDMEDRGGDTANHFDHVHVSFNNTPGPVTPTC